MGGSVGNTFVRSDDQQAVVDVVERLMQGRKLQTNPFAGLFQAFSGLGLGFGDSQQTYVSPSINGWVGIFEQSLEGALELDPAWTHQLSNELDTVAISFHIHDDEYLEYALVRGDTVLDQFHSMPRLIGAVLSKQERKALLGNPTVLANACGRPEAATTIQAKWKSLRQDPLDLLEAFGDALGIANVTLSYRWIWGNDEVDAVGWANFRTVPRPSPR